MKAAILGVGLIGGSLALCLKERTSCHVSGYDLSQKTLDWAVAAGVIDDGSRNLEEAVEDADFIFLAVPVGTIPELLSRLERQSLSPGCIISDVGSTKGKLVRWSEPFRKRGVTYIGGHPMAGSHRSGVEAAHSLLFENAYYILTPSPETPLSEVQKLSGLLQEATRAKLVIMDPFHHDRLVGAISHLPHVIASGLVNQVGRYNEENEWFHRLAAGGFRDLTRIAASHPVMWRDILMSNRGELLKLMDDWLSEMEKVRDAIKRGDAEKIEDFFRRAKFLRERLPERRKGMLLPSFECYVDVPDQPGMIGRVAMLLGEEGINLSNIGIMENREDTAGVLRLVFQKEEDLKRAIRFLNEAGYRVFSFD
ncbi:prephenate dehydrogenase [Planifilum fimeticola]|uniref:Prephenate dehydrogenase n=1 Tax=Planifilum fimeticola TaxID=201975 RepID=A0A2T0LDC7_9BACL|nr:prephenate dehydrogenase [Planifilum fimeticola]PRX40066.1 prephenate dehydrogenase [Planifilum fimeticola]